MANVERFGVEAFANVSNFLQGVAKYNKGIADMIAASGRAEAAVAKSGVGIRSWGQSTRFIDEVTGKIISQKAALDRLVVAWAQVNTEQQKATKPVKKEAAAPADTAKGLENVALAMKKATGSTAELIQNLGKLGIKFDDASNKWKTSSGNIVQGSNVVVASAAKMANQINALGQAAANSGGKQTRAQRLVQASTLLVAKAQDQLTKAQQAAVKAVEDAAVATKDKASKEQAASVALGQLSMAQTNYNNAVKTAQSVVNKQTGTVAQAKNNWEQFVSVLGVAVSVVTKFIAVLGLVALALGAVAKVAQTVGNAIGSAFKFLLTPVRAAIDHLKKFFDAVKSIAFGVMVRDTIRSIAREIRLLGEAAIQAASDFQVLQVRLESMETRLVGQVRGIEDYSDALQEGTGRAAAMLEWIKKLSLTAPFDVKAIADTVALNMAMGFGEKQTMSLTQSMMTFAAAMGLGSEHMERMVFNFGQMKAAGKVTSTELRDLARGAFLPLARISEEMGKIMGNTAMSIQEVKDAAAEGTLPVEVFFQAFENMVAKDFPGAMEKFANTLVGVKTRFVNFMKTVVGLEILGPTVKRFSEIANNALNNLLTPEILEKAAVLGQILLRSFDIITTVIHNQLQPALKNLAEALGLPVMNAETLGQTFANVAVFIGESIKVIAHFIEDLARFVSNTLGEVGDGAFQWGYNIIAFLARGMAAALKLVLQVIQWIANAISSLLGPGSPPEILPDLPEWGMEAMTWYLKGFTMADFDVLEGIQGPLERALRILVETGKITETELGKTFVKISEGIAKVLAGDMSPEKLFNQIRKAGGPWGEELAELARRQIELAGAVDAVAAAEKRLADARKAEEAARIKVAKGIREYNALLREGASEDVLRDRLAIINADEEAAQAAHEEAVAAEEQLKAAEEQEKKWQELVDLQTKLVEQLLKLTEIQIITPEQPDGGAGGGGAGGGAGFEGIGAGLDSALDEMLANLEKKKEEIKTKIDEMFQKARDTVAGWMTQIGTWFAPATAQIEPTIKAITDLWDKLNVWWDENGPTIIAAWETFKFIMGLIFEEAARIIGEKVGEIIDSFDVMDTDGAQELDRITKAIIGSLEFMSVAIGVPVILITSYFSGLTTGFLSMKKAAEDFEPVIKRIENIATAFGILAESVKRLVTGEGSIMEVAAAFLIIQEAIKQLPAIIIGSLTTGAITLFSGLIGLIVGFVTTLLGWFDTLRTGANEKTTSTKDDIINNFQSMKDEVVGNSIVPDMITAILAEFDKFIAYINDPLTTTIRTFIDEPMEDLRLMFVDKLYTAILANKEFALTPWNDYIKNTVIGTVDDLTDPTLSNLEQAFRDLQTAINGVSLISLKTQFDSVRASVVALIASIRELIAAINAIPNVPNPKIETPAARVSAPATGVGLASAMNTVNLNMGGVGIYNAMDEATFIAKVEQAVRRSL